VTKLPQDVCLLVDYNQAIVLDVKAEQIKLITNKYTITKKF